MRQRVGLCVLVLLITFVQSAQAQELPARWNIGLRVGAGRTTLIGKVVEVCSELRTEFGDVISAGGTFNCTGDDSGAGWTFGGELVRRIGMGRWDVGGRVDITRPADVTIEHSLVLGVGSLLTQTLTEGWKFGFAPQIGFSATDRLRVYGGVGTRHFDFETDGVARFQSPVRDETETFGSTSSGWAPRFFGGAEYVFWRGMRSALAAYFEGERHWLEDEDTDFDVTESELLFGLTYRFGWGEPQ